MAYQDAPTNRYYLKEWRAFRGLSTMSELASLTGLDLSTLSRLESGERLPRFATAQKIAKALGTSVSELRQMPGNQL